MLDELKLNLGSKFMRKLAAKALSKFIKKSFGYDIEINLDELKLDFIDGEVEMTTKVGLKMNRDEFTRIAKEIEEQL